LFGNERKYHRLAQDVANRFSIKVFVFEEGYLRPHYITLEKDGVNGRSSVPSNPEGYLDIANQGNKRALSAPNPFPRAGWYATVYFIAGWLGRAKFPHYQHHRPFNPYREAGIWLRAAFRKYYYQIKERGILSKLARAHSKQFFLVPLQVHNDAQIKTWSSVPSSAAFIRRVISSFSKHAPAKTILVIKHHPLDRGYCDYTRIIRKLTLKFGCTERVLYVHDLHLPTLLDHARGTIQINSTVGISSILHGTPVQASGSALYDMEGLTFQGKLEDFWINQYEIDKDLNRKFRQYLIENNQINGNFYQRISAFNNHSGIDLKQFKKFINVPSLKPVVVDSRPPVELKPLMPSAGPAGS
jgi:capsular polysaccharide export protein